MIAIRVPLIMLPPVCQQPDRMGRIENWGAI
jgi:hypothetical protein